MAHEVLLPQWSMGMQDGQITRWLKAPAMRCPRAR